MIEQAPPRPVRRRHQVHLDRGRQRHGLPPVQGLGAAHARPDEVGVETEGHQDPGPVPGRDLPERGQVAVVVVRVADHDGVDARQPVQGHGRRPDPARPHAPDRSHARRPHRIREEVQALGLHEHGRVAHQGHHQPLAVHPRWRRGRVRVRHLPGPPRRPPREQPAEHPTGRVTLHVPEPPAVEVIAHGTSDAHHQARRQRREQEDGGKVPGSLHAGRAYGHPAREATRPPPAVGSKPLT